MKAQATHYLTAEDQGEILVIHFVGPRVPLNEENTPAIARELFRFADAFAGRAFRVELDNVPFVSTPGLTMLLQFRKRVQASQGQVHLTNLQPHIAEVFQVTGLESVFDLQLPKCSASLA